MRSARTVLLPAGTSASRNAPFSSVSVPLDVPTTNTCTPGSGAPDTWSVTVPWTEPVCCACAASGMAAMTRGNQSPWSILRMTSPVPRGRIRRGTDASSRRGVLGECERRNAGNGGVVPSANGRHYTNRGRAPQRKRGATRPRARTRVCRARARLTGASCDLERSDNMSQPEAWLGGPVEGISAALQPVAHSFVQVQRDLEQIVPLIEPQELWVSPGGAASLGFHLQHLAGATDRLLTYARGEQLQEAQMEWLRCEGTIRQGATPMDLLELVVQQLA